MSSKRNNTTTKRQRVRLSPVKKWSDWEIRKVLQYIYEMGVLTFELPTAQVYYRNVLEKTNIEAPWRLLRYKMRNLKCTFEKATEWLKANNVELYENVDGTEYINAQVLNMCPHYERLKGLFENRARFPSNGISMLKNTALTNCTEDASFSQNFSTACETFIKDEPQCFEEQQSDTLLPSMNSEFSSFPMQQQLTAAAGVANKEAVAPHEHLSTLTPTEYLDRKLQFDKEKFYKEHELQEKKLQLEHERLKQEFQIENRKLKLEEDKLKFQQEIRRQEFELKKLVLGKEERVTKYEIDTKYKNCNNIV